MEYENIFSYIKNTIKSEITNADKWIDGNKNQSSFSIKFFKKLVVVIKYRKKDDYYYLDFPNECQDTSELTINMAQTKTGHRFAINSKSDLDNAIVVLKKIYSKLESKYSEKEDFGCCHLYEQCSDEKKCLLTDVVFSNRCQYKRNLEAGQIFYGRNRNV